MHFSEFTTWGNETSSPSYKYNACPGGLGRYHADIHHPGMSVPLVSLPEPLSTPWWLLTENETVVNPLLLAGCAIAISDTTNIEEVTAENLTIISVQSQCVMNKFATFAVSCGYGSKNGVNRNRTHNLQLQIPATLPACTGGYCICSWHWLAKEGLVSSPLHIPFFNKRGLPLKPPSTGKFSNERLFM